MEDTRKRIKKHCADLDVMSPAYKDEQEQRRKIAEWLQIHDDLALKLTALKKNILKTNLATNVEIKIGLDPNNLKPIVRTITEWVIRRREIISLQIAAYSSLTADDNLAERGLRYISDIETKKKLQNARVRLYFDANERDKKIDTLKNEKESIDKALEIANATTDLIE